MRHGTADADGDGQSLLLIPDQKSFDCAAQVLGNGDDPVRIHLMHEDDELLAAETCDDVGGSQGLRQGGSDGLDHGIAGGMPVSVVDLLEEIDVEEQYGQGAFMVPMKAEN